MCVCVAVGIELGAGARAPARQCVAVDANGASRPPSECGAGRAPARPVADRDRRRGRAAPRKRTPALGRGHGFRTCVYTLSGLVLRTVSLHMAPIDTHTHIQRAYSSQIFAPSPLLRATQAGTGRTAPPTAKRHTLVAGSNSVALTPPRAGASPCGGGGGRGGGPARARTRRARPRRRAGRSRPSRPDPRRAPRACARARG
jgi:hypothetical protein